VCVCVCARAQVTWLEPGLLRLSEVRQHRPHTHTQWLYSKWPARRGGCSSSRLYTRAPNAAAASSSYTARAFSLNRYATPRARARPVRRSDPKNQCRPPRRTTTTTATHKNTHSHVHLHTRTRLALIRTDDDDDDDDATAAGKPVFDYTDSTRGDGGGYRGGSARGGGYNAPARVCVKRRRSRRPARHRWPLVIGKLPALFVARDTERVRRNRINQTQARARALGTHTHMITYAHTRKHTHTPTRVDPPPTTTTMTPLLFHRPPPCCRCSRRFK